MPRRVLEGKVVSDKMDKTVTVLVTRRFMHPLYKKFVRKTKKYAAHDDSNAVKVGDIVQIEECKPISKRKSWKVITASETRAAFQEDKKSSGSKTGAKTKTAKKKTAKKDKAKAKSKKEESAKKSKAKKTKKSSKTKAETTPKSEKKDTKKKTTKKKSTSKKKDDK